MACRNFKSHAKRQELDLASTSIRNTMLTICPNNSSLNNLKNRQIINLPKTVFSAQPKTKNR
jgi:hypothetical protein